LVAGKARVFKNSESPSANKRNKFALYALGRGNDNQTGSYQFSSQEGFTPINQTGLEDSTKALTTGSQFSGGWGFKLRGCDLTAGVLDITADGSSGDFFENPPGDIFFIGPVASDLEFINFPKFQGHRLSIFVNAAQTLTIKNTAAATVYAIKTGTGADLVIGGGEETIVEFVWSITLGQWLVMATGGGGGAAATCPTICPEVDLGDVSGAVNIDWSLGPFFRMKLVGNISVLMLNLPTAPGWHEITVEFLQDGVGGHSVTFLDIFRNDPDVIIRQGTNRYTITKFYSYFDVFDNILQWQPPFLEVISANANQGIIHTIMSVDQGPVPVPVGAHVQFDTILFTNQMTVTSGAGQLSGIFGGFIPGRTYELESSIAVEFSGVGGPNFLSYQWFDIAAGVFIGNHGTATDIQVVDRWQTNARAFFQPSAITDTVELRVISNNVPGIDIIIASPPPSATVQRPQSYAIIKDCGQTPEQVQATIDEDLPDLEIPPAPPVIGFSAKMMHYNFAHALDLNLVQDGGEVAIPIEGASSVRDITVGLNDDTLPSRFTNLTNVGRLRQVRMRIDQNTSTKALDVILMKNDVEQTVLFQIPAGGNITLVFPPAGKTSIPLEYNNAYWYKLKSTDGLAVAGSIGFSLGTEIFWGGASAL